MRYHSICNAAKALRPGKNCPNDAQDTTLCQSELILATMCVAELVGSLCKVGLL